MNQVVQGFLSVTRTIRGGKRALKILSVGLYVCGGCAVRCDVMSLLHPFLSHWSDMYFRFLMINGNELLTDVHTLIT